MKYLEQIQIGQRTCLPVFADPVLQDAHSLVGLSQRHEKFGLLANIEQLVGVDRPPGRRQHRNCGLGLAGLAQRAVRSTRLHEAVERGLAHLHKTDVDLRMRGLHIGARYAPRPRWHGLLQRPLGAALQTPLP